MVESLKKARLVGEFIKQKREGLRMSQRALGQLFDPPVSTQFISNLERGVTPLPPTHVATLVKALSTTESEIMALLEKEYALKLGGRLGKSLEAMAGAGQVSGSSSAVHVAASDLDFVQSLYNAYKNSNDQTKAAFHQQCENLLKIAVKSRSTLPS